MSVRRRGLIFGVVLLAYFGHVSVGNCGKLVLRRDPSGRSLIWGTVAAQGVAIVLYCIWVLGGALCRHRLRPACSRERVL